MDARSPAVGARDATGRAPAAPHRAPRGPATPSVVGRLGPYRLLQVIGGGGMGVVHLGLDPAGRAVAIKVLRPHVAAEPSARSRLAREVDALQRVRSLRVAEVLDADPDAEQPYVVTEFVPAPALDALVEREGPMAGAALGRLGLGLGDALAAIHAAGVVHRDLKPGNVLVGDDGEPVVIDFGIAQVADDVRLTSAGLVMGTPGYLSPEVLDGDSVTASGDWWGWAATLAYAATGRPPFGGGPVEAVLSRVRRGAADLEGVPGDLAEVLRAALSSDPARRPPPRRLRQVAQALLDASEADGGWPLARTPGSVATTTALSSGAPAAGAAPAAGTAGTVQLPPSAPLLPGAPPEAAPVPWPEPPRRAAASASAVVVPSAGTAPGVGTAPGTAATAGAAAVTTAVPAGPAAAVTTALPERPQTRALPVEREEPTPFARPAPARDLPPAPPSPYAPAPPPYAPVDGRGARDGSDERSGREPAGGGHGRPVTGAVLLLLLLVAVTLGAVAPLVAALAVAATTVLARTVDRAAAAAVRRRYERGPRRSDAARTAVAVPGHLVVAALASLPALLLPAAMAVSTAFLVGWAIAPQDTPVPGQALPLASAVLVGTATAWWGPGGRSVRRGTRTAVRGALPGRTSSAVVAALLALVVLACVLVVVSAGGVPDWTPLTQAPLGLG